MSFPSLKRLLTRLVCQEIDHPSLTMGDKICCKIYVRDEVLETHTFLHTVRSVMASSSKTAAPTKRDLAWIIKHEPKRVEDVVRPSNGNLGWLSKEARTRKLPHLLLHGPTGTGKRALAIALICEIWENNAADARRYTLHIDALAERGKETECIAAIKVKASVWVPDGAVFIVCIHNADHMIEDFQNALHRIIETSSPTMRFILLVTHWDRLTLPLRSRCHMLWFPPLSYEILSPVLVRILKKEGFRIKDDALREAVVQSDGKVRRAIAMLQRLSTTLVPPRPKKRLKGPLSRSPSELALIPIDAAGVRELESVPPRITDEMWAIVTKEPRKAGTEAKMAVVVDQALRFADARRVLCELERYAIEVMSVKPKHSARKMTKASSEAKKHARRLRKAAPSIVELCSKFSGMVQEGAGERCQLIAALVEIGAAVWGGEARLGEARV
jgi:DNA polymerase III delta prime subunit